LVINMQGGGGGGGGRAQGERVIDEEREKRERGMMQS
jgi:hypothetical protein